MENSLCGESNQGPVGFPEIVARHDGREDDHRQVVRAVERGGEHLARELLILPRQTVHQLALALGDLADERIAAPLGIAALRDENLGDLLLSHRSSSRLGLQ